MATMLLNLVTYVNSVTKLICYGFRMDTLEQLAEAVATIDDATQRRNQLIQQAREEGHTWRAVAAAAGMTEHGIRKIVTRTSDES